MKLKYYCYLILLLSIISCKNKHFISDTNYRNKVERQFEKQKLLAANRSKQLFSVFDKSLTNEEKEALEFLFAFMPLNDLADYDGDFYLKNVRSTFEAKNTFKWCNTVPEDIFRHFVLPIRINNEELDSSRTVFFKELKNRVKDLSMKDAALEVNHWCLEKATYHGADPRTSSPLNTVKSAYGRCGEESTFYVAALRSVGIPARQCYTPRWAATDDNHAWVEMWVDGKWYFEGACEPAADLNMGWFAEPAKRAMLVHTTVFGDYNGPEEVICKTESYTRINVLKNYTKVKTIFVKAIDDNNNPILGANVDFGLYNYAEFFTLTTQQTDKNGICHFTSGLGDLVIWASHNNQFGFEKLSVATTDTIIIKINKNSKIAENRQFDITPPSVIADNKEINKAEQVKINIKNCQNAKRWAKDDSIRKLYTSTFVDSAKSVKLIANLKYNNDSLRKILEKSHGNWQTILKFIKTESKYNSWKLPLLYSLKDKDLRDISFEVLSDHLENAFTHVGNIDKSNRENFINYILCPRISWEKSSAYKKMFQREFKPEFIKATKKDIGVLVNWCKKNIKINNEANYYHVALTPRGTYELKVSDEQSIDILFIAICRSFGIPSKIDIITQKTQCYINNFWIDIKLNSAIPIISNKKGTIIFDYDFKNNDLTPIYSKHFTIAKYNNGKYSTLDYEDNSIFKIFPAKVELDAGDYKLVTGYRMKEGSVFSNISFFEVKESQTNTVKISIRQKDEEKQIMGTVNPSNILAFDNCKLSISALANKNATIIAWIDTEKEPTKHYLNECMELKSKFDKWGGNFVLLFPNNVLKSMFNIAKFKNLPNTTKIGIDKDNKLLQQVEESAKSELKGDLPAIIVVNEKGEIIFLAKGYSIGIGERVSKAINSNIDCKKGCSVNK